MYVCKCKYQKYFFKNEWTILAIFGRKYTHTHTHIYIYINTIFQGLYRIIIKQVRKTDD